MENLENMPRHVAIIPDGNRRWARKRTLSAWMGHKKGSENLETLLEVFVELKIPYFSFWGSSQDNITKRPKEEIDQLLKIFKEEFARLADSDKVHDNEIRINIIGSWREQFPDDVKDSMEKAIRATEDYDKYFYNFFIAYSGIDEMRNAVENIAELKTTDPNLIIDEALIKSQLLTKDLPPVDFLIRTGGEPHNSGGFMMWDVTDSQLFFSEKLWPDFSNKDLKDAIMEYSHRERRMGK
ncbi:MAG: polyprenyl diphosphate synthase [Candidatus Pacebacteria bacterium]|nr:polyprenyl diphosphate synthase [Candidatus Paceibacterota bacterium]